jgi:hypothetical protein
MIYLRRVSFSGASQSFCIYRKGGSTRREGELTSATRPCCFSSSSRMPKSGPASKLERFGKPQGRVRKGVSRVTLTDDSPSTHPLLTLLARLRVLRRHRGGSVKVSSMEILPLFLCQDSDFGSFECIPPFTPGIFSLTTMSRIEELPDDFDESLNLNEPNASPIPPTTASKGHTTQNDQTVPGADMPESKTADELLDMMRNTPLFMTSLDDAEAGTPYSGFINTAHVI